MLLSLDRLMQAVGIAAAGHYTSGELINYEYLVVLNNVILVAEHKVVCPQRKYRIVLYVNVLGIRKVVYLEESLDLLNALCGKSHELVLFINYKVTRLLALDAHDGIHL